MKSSPNKSLPAPKLMVEEVMTLGIHRVRPEMKVYEAIEMLTQFRISGAPVVDQLDNLLSVVSEGDLMRLAANQGLDSTIAHCLPDLPKQNSLVTLKKEDSFTDAYKLFLKHSLHRIIVIDANGRLNGIVTRADVLRLFVESRHGKKIPQQNR